MRSLLDGNCLMLTKEELSAILYKHDPEGLAKMGAPSDEYNSEAEIILPMLVECDDADDVQELLYDTFAAMFGGEKYNGWFSTFLAPACEIWKKVSNG
jgi:hypothetical protein